MKKLISLLLVVFFIAFSTNAQNTILRYPAINPQGTELLFSYQGDIWKAPVNGGTALRLTVNDAYEGFPRWSDDGKQIAFSSKRFGNYDLFLMNAEGNNIRRLTYRSSDDYLYDFTNGKMFFTTRRDFRQVEWTYEIYSVNEKGGTPERILDAVGNMPALSPDGKYLAYVSGACRIEREAYKGPANLDIWIYDIENKTYKRITSYEGNDFMPRWKDDGTLYFISSRSGKYNIFSVNIHSNEKPQQITNNNDFGIFYFDVAKKSDLLVYEKKGEIFTYNLKTKKTSHPEFLLNDDFRKPQNEFRTATSGVEEFSVSPDGKYSAFVIHGDIFVTKNNDKKITVNITHDSYRQKSPQWVNNNLIVYLSDENGNYEIYSVKPEKDKSFINSLDFGKARLTKTEADENQLKVSPDRKKIAYLEGRGKLVVANISDDGNLSDSKILLDGWANPEGVVWSPDSRWLAYSKVDLDGNDEIYIQDAEGKIKPVNVSMHPKGDYEPFWTPDGSKLLFTSERNNGDFDIWLAWLKKSDWEKSKSDWEEKENEGKDADKKDSKKSKKKKDKSKVEPIKIDLENIYERLVQVTSLAGDERNPVSSKDGETIYFVAQSPTSKGRDLFKIKWDGTKIEQITKGGKSPKQIQLAGKDKSIFMNLRGGKIAKLKGGKKLDFVSFKAKFEINYPTERKQIFNEAWRALNENFYDPDFHGQNWSELRKIYEPVILSASTYEDFRYMFNVMIGQVNSSHMGFYPPRNSNKGEQTGLLGVEVVPVNNGVKILRVIPGTPADKEESRLYENETITKVNGKQISDMDNFYSYFTNTSGEKVRLTVENTNGESREVVIRPVSSIRDQLYKEWVETERRLVEKFSDGKLGYLHIKAMGWDNFEKFDRDLAAAGYGKDGLVIDVRYNGGGWITDYLLTVLNYKQHAYTIPRGAAKSLKEHSKFRSHYPFGERLPFSAWTKKSIALCNSRSYSNAEIFSHAYKTLSIGTLVGEATFGAVISTGGMSLIDGSYIRLPFRAWYVLKTDKNMEFGPAVPNVEIENPQNWKIGNNDLQLKKAVEILLQQINNDKK